MRRRHLPLLVLLCLLAPAPAQAELLAEPFPARPAGRYLVILDPTSGPPAAQALTHALLLGIAPDQVFQSALDGYSASVPAAALPALLALPGVRSVVPDLPVEAFGQRVPTGVARVGGFTGTGGADDDRAKVNADVAVLDSGIDRDHPDLDVVGGVDCTKGAGGRAGYDDPNGHGTHVAGIAAAADDGQGVVGVAPGARLWAVRVLDEQGHGALSSVLCGIDWVTAHADVIDVANLSLGTPGRRPAGTGCASGDVFHDAICRSVAAGVTYTVAAGNQATDAGQVVPAAYDEVLTVSALADFDGRPGGQAESGCQDDQDDSLADFSNHGATVDLIAPGTCIVSTWPGGGLAMASGTSMAAPHVTGAAARVKAAHPSYRPAQVRSALLAAGGGDWDAADDPDRRAEPLLHVPARR